MGFANVLPPYGHNTSMRPMYSGPKAENEALSEADSVPISGEQLSPCVASPEIARFMSFNESANVNQQAQNLHSR